MDELNKHNIDDANTENCAPQESTENQQPTMAVGTDAQETKQVAEKNTAAPEVNTDKLICPRCGKAFDQKEKKCPHCGLKNNLKLCKTCGATIAKNAKRCPKCGAKNKKPFYKRLSFWFVVIVLMLIVSCSTSNNNTENGEAASTATTSISDNDIVVGTWIAEIKLDQANDKGYYIDEDQNVKLVIKKDSTIETWFGDESRELEWEFVGESGEVRQYKIIEKGSTDGKAIYFRYVDKNSKEFEDFAGKILVTSGNNLVIYGRAQDVTTSKTSSSTSSQIAATDTPKTSKVVSSKISVVKQNALRQANQYLNAMAFSYSGLIEQLEYEGYSTEDATYAVDHCGADWNDEAAKKAEEYLNTMSFSRSGLIEQLEYEGFTHDQAVYGVNKAY